MVLGLFIAGILRALGIIYIPESNWNEGSSLSLMLVIPFFSLVFIITALLTEKWQNCFYGLKEIQKMTGRLPSDFFDSPYIGGTLLNVGLLGLLYYLYCIGNRSFLSGPCCRRSFNHYGFWGFGKNT